MLSLDKINAITDPKVRRQLKLDILTRVKKSTQEKYRTDFLSFVKYTWPEFIEGYHHKEISNAFNRIRKG